MNQKVGRRYIKSNKNNRPIITSSGGDFTSVVDGITFGVVNGQWFHSGNRAWKPEEMLAWAQANQLFFCQLSKNIEKWADAVKNGSPLKSL